MSSQWHQDYERGRPGYPPSAVQVITEARPASVLELGAGTGKLTRLLVQQKTDVFALEPDPEMRHWLTAACRDVAVLAATAEALPLADSSVDAVCSAEAFHWFAHDRALSEASRVMRPQGRLVLMWNRPAGKVEPPITAVERLLEPLWPEEIEMPLDLDPRRYAYARDWPHAFEGSGFEPLREVLVPNVEVVDQRGLVAFFGSMGWIGSLPDDDRTSLLDDLRSRLSHSEYRMPFETHVCWTQLAGDA